MPNKETFVEEELTIEVVEETDTIAMNWLGRSVQRNPGKFLIPILTDNLEKCINLNKAMVWNFQDLQHMNSSTITPIIKSLQIASKGSHRVMVLYNKSKKWQDLSFSALKVFETRDGRIKIVGA
jgi:hypothetical protein